MAAWGEGKGEDRRFRELAAVAREKPTGDQMGEAISRTISHTVPHDALHLMGMNPGNGVVSLAFWHQYTPELANAQLLASYSGDDPVRPTDLARLRRPVGTVGAPSAPYEALVANGLGSELRLLLRDGGRAWGLVSLMRESGRPAFAEEDAGRALALMKPLAGVLRAFVTAVPLVAPGASPAPGVFVVGPDQSVRGMTPDARAWLRRLRLPEPIANERWLAPAITGEVALAARQRDGLDARARRPQLCIPAALTGQWITVEAQPLDAGGNGDLADDVAVVIHAAGPDELLGVVSSWYGVTPRERAVVRHLCEGETVKRIARLLELSPHTVNDHLKSVYRKTGTGGRDELVAALGG